MSTAATPPQQPNVKYTRLWEGILAGQRQQKPVPICKLEVCMLAYPTFNASGDTSPCLLSSSGVVLNEHSW
jgi:hypothetical protein